MGKIKIAKTKAKEKISLTKKSAKRSRRSRDVDMSCFPKKLSSVSPLGALKLGNTSQEAKIMLPKAAKLRGVDKIKKKEKLKTKKKILLKKIDIVTEMKRNLRMRDKRKNTALIGDTNPLHDALPSIEPLLEMKHAQLAQPKESNKKMKGVEKAGKRRKQILKDVEIFKRALKDETFKTNPFDTISKHIQSVVQFDRNKNQ